jgi:hypothetical protein
LDEVLKEKTYGKTQIKMVYAGTGTQNKKKYLAVDKN